jgi:hypothetical protein
MYTQRKTAKEKRADEELALTRRVAALRATLRAELTQLIAAIQGEIDFMQIADWTWFPVRDYFEAYRRNTDIVGRLDLREVEHSLQPCTFSMNGWDTCCTGRLPCHQILVLRSGGTFNSTTEMKSSGRAYK